MEKTAIKWTLILMTIISLLSVFIDYRFALGVVLGTVFSLIHYFVLNKNVNSILNNEKTFTSKLGSYFIRLFILAIPLYLSIRFDSLFNIYGAFIGLLLLKISLVVSTIFVENRNNNDRIY
ncbi:MAG: ATP synthase subunit I [Erysipelotrichaceae bacterium]